uniref:Uncharacterized protein n=1 Tax=Vespula pensylvanica TaxID=30213 RepID=A0A834P1Q7_VESPE|nr:hypothetical protein H0235_007646 [Vespula pensylvanica]
MDVMAGRKGRSYLLQQQQPVAMHRRIIYLCVTASVGTGNFPSDKERLRKLQLKQGEKGTDSSSSSSSSSSSNNSSDSSSSNSNSNVMATIYRDRAEYDQPRYFSYSRTTGTQ